MSWLNGFNQHHLNILSLLSKQSPGWLTSSEKIKWAIPLPAYSYLPNLGPLCVHKQDESGACGGGGEGSSSAWYRGACLSCQSRKQLPVCKMVWGPTSRNSPGHLLLSLLCKLFGIKYVLSGECLPWNNSWAERWNPPYKDYKDTVKEEKLLA